MKNLLLVIFSLFLSCSFAQRAQFFEAKDLKLSDTYIGTNSKDLHYFVRGLEIFAVNDQGRVEEEYKWPLFLKYDNQNISLHEVVIWNDKPYVIARSEVRPGTPVIYVLFDMKDGRKPEESDGILLASFEYAENDAWKRVKFHEKAKIINDELCYMMMVVPNLREEYSTKITTVSINTSFKIQKNCNYELPPMQVLKADDIDFDSKHAYLDITVHEQGAKMVVLDLNGCTAEVKDFHLIEGHTMYVYKHFIHPNGKLYRIGGMAAKDDERKSFYLQKFNQEMESLGERVLDIRDLPSYGISGKVEKQWSDGSAFSDRVDISIINYMHVRNIFLDDAQNIIVVYELKIGNTWVDGSGQSHSRRVGQEIIVASYDPEKLEENWRVVIPRNQDAENASLGLSQIDDHKLVGMVTYPYKTGVLVVYNDHYDNRVKRLTDMSLEEFKKEKQAIVTGVYVDKTGRAKKVGLTHEKGEALLIDWLDPHFEKPNINANSNDPLILVKSKRDIMIGRVN